jgi:glyoxylase-like metal-dependent hydrolase (beta-lactamase superfamily II)
MPPLCFRFKVGEFECAVFKTAETAVGVATAFGSTPPEEVAAAIRAEGRDPDEYPFVVNLLYVKTPEHQFLVDAGTGKADFLPEADDLVNDLKALDIDPTAIDTVILTHAHWDHYAGLHDSAGNLTFPNAQYFMNKVEWDFCTAEEQLNSADENDPNPVHVRKILLPLRDRIHLIEPETEMLPGVCALAAPGHTVGQIAVLITSNGEGLLHVADVTHHPFQVEHPDWTLGFDPLQDDSRQTRHKLLERAVRDNLLWMGYHFSFPAVGHVVKDADGFHWQPIIIDG